MKRPVCLSSFVALVVVVVVVSAKQHHHTHKPNNNNLLNSLTANDKQQQQQQQHQHHIKTQNDNHNKHTTTSKKTTTANKKTTTTTTTTTKKTTTPHHAVVRADGTSKNHSLEYSFPDDCPSCGECCTVQHYPTDMAEYELWLLCCNAFRCADHPWCHQRDSLETPPFFVDGPNICPDDKIWDGEACVDCRSSVESCGQRGATVINGCGANSKDPSVDNSMCACPPIPEGSTFIYRTNPIEVYNYWEHHGRSNCYKSENLIAGLELVVKDSKGLKISFCGCSTREGSCDPHQQPLPADEFMYELRSFWLGKDDQHPWVNDNDVLVQETNFVKCGEPVLLEQGKTLGFRRIDPLRQPMDNNTQEVKLNGKSVAERGRTAINKDAVWTAEGNVGFWDNLFMRGLVKFCAKKAGSFSRTFFQPAWFIEEQTFQYPLYKAPYCCLFQRAFAYNVRALMLPEYQRSYISLFTSDSVPVQFKPGWETGVDVKDTKPHTVYLKRFNCPEHNHELTELPVFVMHRDLGPPEQKGWWGRLWSRIFRPAGRVDNDVHKKNISANHANQALFPELEANEAKQKKEDKE